MGFNIKLKEKHYKKTRFGTKSEKEMSDFKKKNITHDLQEKQEKGIGFLKVNYDILTTKNQVSIPKKNEITCVRTQSQLNLLTLFLHIINKENQIEFLSIQSYTINEKTIFALLNLMKEKKILKLQLIITETASFRTPKAYKLLKDVFSKMNNVNLVFYWVHSKVNLIKTKKNYYVLDGSGNFSMNAQIEHYNIINSKELFDFDMKWQDNFFFGEKLRKNHEIYKNF